MTVRNWRVEAATQTTLSFWVESTTNESITLAIDGQSIGIQTNGVNNTGWFEVDSLDAGTTYDFTVEGEAGYAKTLPADDEASSFAWMHCKNARSASEFGEIILANQPDFMAYGGDTPYTQYKDVEKQITLWGRDLVSSDHLDNGSTYPHGICTREQMRQWHLAYLLDPGLKMVNQRTPNFWIVDDHEFPGPRYGDPYGDSGAGFDHSEDEVSWVGGQSDVDDIYKNCINAWRDIHPSMPWAAINKDKPALSADANANEYPVNCYKIRSGVMEIFFLDGVGGKSRNLDSDTASKLLLGANQRTWLEAQLSASTAPFKVICSGKSVIQTSITSNGDGWMGRQTQLAAILAAIETAGVTGVLWVCGDGHQPSFTDEKKTDGFAHNLASMVAGPGNSKGWNTGSLVTDSGMYDLPESAPTDLYSHRCVGFVSATADRLTARIVDSRERTFFIGTMLPSSNNWDTIETPHGISPTNYPKTW